MPSVSFRHLCRFYFQTATPALRQVTLQLSHSDWEAIEPLTLADVGLQLTQLPRHLAPPSAAASSDNEGALPEHLSRYDFPLVTTCALPAAAKSLTWQGVGTVHVVGDELLPPHTEGERGPLPA